MTFWLFLLSVLTACNRQPEGTPGIPQTASPANYFQTHFQDESQFIVEATLMDLAEMADYARTGKRPDKLSIAAIERPDSPFRQPSYDVEIILGTQKIQKRLNVTGPIWAPALYEEFARALLASTPAAASPQDRNDLSALVALADLKASTIESENQRISELLEKNFKDPALHEMAAVVLGALALREFSGEFYDVRSLLCRMTAHLAFAKAQSSGTSMGANGRVAEIMLLTLMNNQKDALQKLAAMDNEAKLKPWVNALRVRNNHDYRELLDAPNRTGLESIMFYSAISRCINSDAGWEGLDSELVTSFSDFGRIAFGENYSVSQGHQLHEITMPLELAEIAKVQALSTGGAPSGKEDLINFLNQIPERCFLPESNRVRIIGPGQWGWFLQRHMCHTLQHNFTFLHNKWGVKDEAKKFAAETDKMFGQLRLYPFVRRFNARTEAEYHRAVDEGMPVTVATPHLVSAAIWNYLSSAPRFAARYWPGAHPHVNEWHKHNPPPGTAYNPAPRLYHPSLVNRSDSTTVLEQLHELAPYDAAIADGLLQNKYRGKDNFQQAEEILRPVIAYSARQNLHLAKHTADDPTKYEEIMGRYAKLNPAGYFTLGRYFADRQQAEKAAGFYEKGIETGTDAVLMSNNCEWLVQHYFAKGEREKAEALANQAAEVYSSRGLQTKAGLMELQKNYDEALEYYRRNEERYNQSGPLVGFCVRYKAETADSRFDKLVQVRIKTLFPRGIEKVGAKDFKSAPEEGVLISQDSDSLRQAGLKKGDVIVALDGIRVYDMTQYQYVRELTNALEMSLIVWTGSAFTDRNVSPPKRRFGVPFSNFYQPANSKP